MRMTVAATVIYDRKSWFRNIKLINILKIYSYASQAEDTFGPVVSAPTYGRVGAIKFFPSNERVEELIIVRKPADYAVRI